MRKTRKTRDWYDWLETAKEYRQTYGDLLVPSRYVTPEGYKLGRWIERQRAVYNGNTKIKGGLCLDQIAALNAIGMVWKLESRYPWESWLDLCDGYVRENGNLLVPKECVFNNARLGYWIGEQRKKYAEGKLTEQQINDLNERKMVWSLSRRRAWEDWFADARRYYDSHGNLLVPLKHVTEDGELLGQWIFCQRDHRSRRESYPEAYIQQLDSIGMVWDLEDVRNAEWEQMYGWVKDYLNQHGRLPLWPRKQYAPDGRTMDGWINVQRTRLSKNKVSAVQKKRLNEIGIYPFGQKLDHAETAPSCSVFLTQI